MVPVALALGASLAWGASDFLAGLKTRRLALLWVLLVSQATGLVLVGVAALASGAPLPGGDAALLAAGAGVAELIGFAALYSALADRPDERRGADLGDGRAAADHRRSRRRRRADRPCRRSAWRWRSAGAALASFEYGGDHRRAATGVGLAVVAALGFGAFFVGTDLAADDGALWAVAINRAAAVAVLVVDRRSRCAGRRRSTRDQIAPLAAVGALDISANVMFAIALTVGMAAAVSVLGSLYPVATVVLARAILHEQLSVQPARRRRRRARRDRARQPGVGSRACSST